MTKDPNREIPLTQLAKKFFSPVFSFTPPDHLIQGIERILGLLRKWLVSPNREEGKATQDGK